MSAPHRRARPRVLRAGWWLRDPTGRVRLAQAPNPALLLWLAATVTAGSGALAPQLGAQVATLGRGALLVWAVDELVRGDAPVRRLLGAGVLTALVAGLLR